MKIVRIIDRITVLAVVLAWMTGSALGAVNTWQGATTDWFAPGNWSLDVAPGPTHTVVIDGAGTVQPMLDFSGVAQTIAALYLGETAAATLTVANGNVSDRKLVVTGDAVIGSNGTLTHAANTTAETHRLFLDIAGSLTIANGGRIDVTGNGYRGSIASKGDGAGPGAGTYVGGNYMGGGGGGYGGEGGNSELGGEGSAGTVYGSVTEPVNLGSGGAEGHSGAGGAGGGAVRLAVGAALVVDGVIAANGDHGSSRGGGGGGGSLWLSCGTFGGSGSITANGGLAPDRGGGGGGGRIRLVYGTQTFSGVVSAHGGTAAIQAGAGGTIYTRAVSQPLGTLIVENDHQATPVTTLIGPLVSDPIVGHVIIRNGGHLAVDATESLTVRGDWSNQADFSSPPGGTVIFDGPNASTISGNTVFHGLTCSVPGKRLNFQAASTTRVSALTLTGAAGAGNRIGLQSTTPGTQWYLNLTAGGAQDVAWVGVEDSNASGGDPIPAPRSTDVANNNNWIFDGAVITWTGAAGPDWGLPGSWDLQRLPVAIDPEVVIANVATRPHLDTHRDIGMRLTIRPGGDLNLNGYNLTVNSHTLIAGSLTATGTETLIVRGHLDFSGGILVPASSTIVLDGAAAQSVFAAGNPFHQLITRTTGGDVTFEDGLDVTRFVCETNGAALVFNAGSEHQVACLTLTGSMADRIALRSSLSGQPWRLNVSGWNAVRGVDVQDSDASGGQTIWAKESVNAGNNTNWDFSIWRVWNGAVSSAFDDPANWVGGQAPGSADSILIDGHYDHEPAVSAPTTLRRLTLAGSSPALLWVNAPLTVTDDLHVFEGGHLTHTANLTESDPEFRLAITVGGDMNLHAGSAIDLTGKGYRGAIASKGDGAGPGAGTYVGGNYMGGGGAGYGGEGGNSELGGEGSAGTVYGPVTEPLRLGSGGAEGHSGHGGAGGGAVRLAVGAALVVDGVIAANGDHGSSRGGGGSGGSLWLSCGTFGGSGSLTANGGLAPDRGGGGGGGRIACNYEVKTFNGTITAAGGSGANNAAAGTVYIEVADAGFGHVIVDNNALPADARTLIPAAIDPLDDELVHAVLVATNHGALRITGDTPVQGLTLVSADEKLDLGGANVRLTVRGMLYPDAAPVPHGLRVNDVRYPRFGFYSQTDWNGYATPENISGDGDLWLRSIPGGVMLVR